jgi:hypothetical protein
MVNKNIKYVLGICLMLILLPIISADWYDNDWNNRIKITINSDSVFSEPYYNRIKNLASNKSDFEGLNFSTDTNNIGYSIDESIYYTNNASGRLSTMGTSNKGTGTITYANINLTSANYLVFWFKGNEISNQWARPSVNINGTEVWAKTPAGNTNYDWEQVVIDVSEYNETNDIEFKLFTDGTGWNYRRFWFDDVILSDVILYEDFFFFSQIYLIFQLNFLKRLEVMEEI